MDEFKELFTVSNIQAGFRNSSMWPLSIAALVGTGVRKSVRDAALVTPAECVRGKDQLLLDIKRFGTFDTVIKEWFC